MPPDYRQLTIAKDFRVRRSELTCPGNSLKMMKHAAASGADEVIFDLEDAVAVSQKAAARASVIEALSTLEFGNKVRAFRVNAIQTPWFEDDVAHVISGAGRFVDVVVLPKVQEAAEVRKLDATLQSLEKKHGLPAGRIQIEVLIESAKGVLHAEAIAAASPRMASLIFGVADYAGDVGARDLSPKRQYALFHYPRSHLLAAARAAGIDAIDSVTLQFRDLDQVREDSLAGAQLGFDGKWAIHPTHVSLIHEAYTPTRLELHRAVALLKAYAAADIGEGKGAIVVGDEMVDAASLRLAWRQVVVGRKAGLLDANDQAV
ncbi:MAG: HpcH/HpaI aldolase/citrate lyase family protein [Myxococcaceae bacterium]